jgi:hypothetical protein
MFLQLVAWFDIIIASKVIELTWWNTISGIDASKMLLGLAGIKILSEIDDVFAKFYLKFVVRSTDDGIMLLKHQGFKVNNDDEKKSKISLNLEFY